MSESMEIESVPRARSSAVLTHVGGLHARPSIKLTQRAKCFECSVWISLSEDGPWTDAKSIARVMTMKTPAMTTLYFSTEGSDAGEAALALARLVENDFTDPDDNAQ